MNVKRNTAQMDSREESENEMMSKFTIASYPDAYVAIDGMKFGRRSAGSGFLEAVCRYVDKDNYALGVGSEADMHLMQLAMAQFKNSTPTANTINLGDQLSLSRNNVLYTPSPALGDLAWSRRFLADDAYSIVGVTHTIATMQVMPVICRYIIEPVQPWDALICTSTAVQKVIENMFEHYLDYLNSRNIAASSPPIQLPIIPLGIHCDHFEPAKEGKVEIKSFRKERGIAKDDVVLLSFGRIDPLSKSHPIPLFLSAEHAQRSLGEDVKLHLIMAGTFAGGEVMEKEIINAGKIYAPSVHIHWVDGKDDNSSRISWQAADIFLSLSDNIQESFGLTPVEAMGSGLPCIVSDWNGYKDTVVHDQTGFRIPTVTPDPSLGIGIHFTSRYCGNISNEMLYMYGISQVTAVDVRRCAEAITVLARDKDRRQEMGRLGKKRAEQLFAWPKVIHQYQALFGELQGIRKSVPGIGMRRGRNVSARPECGDPLKIFKSYSSGTISLNTEVSCVRDDAIDFLDTLTNQPMCMLATDALVAPIDIKLILQETQRKTCTISSLTEMMPHQSPSLIVSTCLWLTKYDLLKIEDNKETSVPI